MAPLPRPADSLECAMVSDLYVELSATRKDAARAGMVGRSHQYFSLGPALWPGVSETLLRLSQTHQSLLPCRRNVYQGERKRPVSVSRGGFHRADHRFSAHRE